MCLDMANNVETVANSLNATHCQEYCNAHPDCQNFSWRTEICFLFQKCEESGHFESCFSGKADGVVSTNES